MGVLGLGLTEYQSLPDTPRNSTRMESNSIVTGGNSQDSQQQHKSNKVNRSDKFDGGDDKSSLLKHTFRYWLPTKVTLTFFQIISLFIKGQIDIS